MTSARQLLDSVNDEETLDQEVLVPMFAKASYLVDSSIELLVRHSTYYQVHVLELGSQVAANLDRNRALYKRTVAFSTDGEFGDIKSSPESRQRAFILSCMDLQHAIASGDSVRQLQVIRNLELNRMAKDSILNEWLTLASDYVELSWQAAKLRLQGDTLGGSQVELQLLKIENELCVSPDEAFGLINTLQLKQKALRKIYENIFAAYSRIVLKMAKSQAISDDSTLENFQNGSFGLMRAISSYDHASNARFVGHARWWVRQSILYHIKEDANLIRVSSNTWQHYAKIQAVIKKHAGSEGELPVERIAKLSGFTPTQVSEVLRTIEVSQVKSLDYPLRGEDDSVGSTVADSIEDTTIEDPLDMKPTDSVKSLLDSLSTRMRNLVCLAYGLTEYVVVEVDSDLIEAEKQRQTKAFQQSEYSEIQQQSA